MSTSIRLSDKIVEDAKRKGALLHRTPPEQIEHWARLGSVMEDVLSCPAQASINAAATRDDVDEALAVAETPAGKERAHAAIAANAAAIVSSD
jgi:hypothetical protein